MFLQKKGKNNCNSKKYLYLCNVLAHWDSGNESRDSFLLLTVSYLYQKTLK